ncbi:MAG: DNA polymerase IV, partial [Pseudomonadota bacterium]
ITVSTGLSYNKFLAKLASDFDKPRGFTAIGQAEARAFLAPLPVGRIHGVGAATERRMAEMGLTNIGQLQAMETRALIARFGRFGHRLAAYVHGQDPRQVTPSRATKSVSAETTFAEDLRDLPPLHERLTDLCDRVAMRLSAKELAGRTVVLKLKTRNFQTMTRNHTLPWPTARADVLLRVGTAMLTRELDGRWYRLIGIGVADLTDGELADPPDLFEAAQMDQPADER